MSKHTKDQWKYDTRASEIGIISQEDDQSYGFLIPFADVYGDDKEKNGRRIVACVNACRGLDTAELEKSGLVSAVGHELIRLEKQRDELLEALETLLEHIGWGEPLSQSSLVYRHAQNTIVEARRE